MRKFIEPFDKRNRSTNPENGTRRIEKETDGINHLQIFYNGSWRHNQKCKLKTNNLQLKCRTIFFLNFTCMIYLVLQKLP